jgi:serine/threonine protein kinase
VQNADVFWRLQGLVKLADFGVAAKLGELEEQHNDELHQNVVGTPYWMAPEVRVIQSLPAAAAAARVVCVARNLQQLVCPTGWCIRVKVRPAAAAAAAKRVMHCNVT